MTTTPRSSRTSQSSVATCCKCWLLTLTGSLPSWHRLRKLYQPWPHGQSIWHLSPQPWRLVMEPLLPLPHRFLPQPAFLPSPMLLPAWGHLTHRRRSLLPQLALRVDRQHPHLRVIGLICAIDSHLWTLLSWLRCTHSCAPIPAAPRAPAYLNLSRLPPLRQCAGSAALGGKPLLAEVGLRVAELYSFTNGSSMINSFAGVGSSGQEVVRTPYGTLIWMTRDCRIYSPNGQPELLRPISAGFPAWSPAADMAGHQRRRMPQQVASALAASPMPFFQ